MSRTRGHSDGLPCSGSGTDTDNCQGKLNQVIFVRLSIFIFKLQLRDHGQVGKHGGHVRPVVDKDLGLDHALTVMGYHALEMTQIQGAAKVYSIWPFLFSMHTSES